MLITLTGVLFVRSRDSGPKYPKEWDSRVTDIVAFDEKERGLTYKHPVEIQFMSEEDFKADVTTSSNDLSQDDRQRIDDATASFRALGLIDGSVDLFKQENDLSGGGTLAYYSSKTKTVRVRGTEITPALRVTLAHELTHALQDQYFDLDASANKLTTDGQKSAFRAVVEGDAVRVQNAYIDAMSETDRAAYTTEDQATGATTGYDKAPPILVANFTAPYTVGPPFVGALKAKGGNTAVDAALRNPPASEAALLDLFTYLNANSVTPVAVPSLDASESRVTDGDFGATTWYLMLAQRLDVHDALKAVDGWAGDSSVTYRKVNNEVCVRANYQGKTPADTDAMATLLQSWADKGTGQSERVTRDGDVVVLNACDPGAEAKVVGTDRSTEAMELLAIRLDVDSEGFKQNAAQDLVQCVGNGVVNRITLDDIARKDAAVHDTFTKAFDAAIAACH